MRFVHTPLTAVSTTQQQTSRSFRQFSTTRQSTVGKPRTWRLGLHTQLNRPIYISTCLQNVHQARVIAGPGLGFLGMRNPFKFGCLKPKTKDDDDSLLHYPGGGSSKASGLNSYANGNVGTASSTAWQTPPLGKGAMRHLPSYQV